MRLAAALIYLSSVAHVAAIGHGVNTETRASKLLEGLGGFDLQ